ncbi:MAG: hypothetical protein KDA81_05280 [Planctomycetaceae bacterium]|nr:hypothetical protein [Planctomycetaceae bacterium]
MRSIVSWALSLTLLVAPTTSYGDTNSDSAVKAESVELKNVELSENGSLRGQIVTSAGSAVDGLTIQFRQGEKTLSAGTKPDGSFAVSGLSSGQCIITMGEDTFACRVWVKGTAPPNSLQSIGLVQNVTGETVRGQFGGWRPGSRLAALTTGQKVGLGLLAIGGVAVAIAVSEDDASN